MDAEIRPTNVELIVEQINGNAGEYSFFQLAQILERWRRYDNRKSDNTFAIERKSKRVRFRNKASLAFPSADIDRLLLEQTGQTETINIYITFLGLFGSASPLASFYTEKILQETDDAQVVADLLDIINHRMIQLLQKIWEKYRYYIQFSADNEDKLSEWVANLSGLPSRISLQKKHLNWSKILSLSGLFAMQTKSAENLLVILQNYFPEYRFSIEEFLPRKVSIAHDQWLLLGEKNHQLGLVTMMGNEVTDCSGKFRVHIHCYSEKEVVSLLPDSDGYKVVNNLIAVYLNSHLTFDISLNCDTNSCLVDQLDADKIRLGWNSKLAGYSPEKSMNIAF